MIHGSQDMQVDVFLLTFLTRCGMRKFRTVDFSRPPHVKG